MVSRPVSFTDVVLCATQGVDYEIRVREPGSAVAIVVLQGGELSPRLVELAEDIAGDEINLYAFVARENRPELRISPLGAREARLDSMLSRSTAVLSLVRSAGGEPAIRAGGRNELFLQELSRALEIRGYAVLPSKVPAIGASPAFFFNRASDGGVQLELSDALCEDLHGGTECGANREAFVEAVRTGLRQYVAAARSDLGRTMDRFERATARFPAEIRTGPGRRERNGDRP